MRKVECIIIKGKIKPKRRTQHSELRTNNYNDVPTLTLKLKNIDVTPKLPFLV